MFQRKNYFVLLVLLMVWFSTASQPNRTGKLRISSNGRYFTKEDGKPFFWLGDTGWLLFSKLNREEAIKYLDDRQKKVFNVIQAMLLHEVKVVNAFGDTALISRNVDRPAVTEGNAFSDSTQYDYWDHVDYIIDEAATRGFIWL